MTTATKLLTAEEFWLLPESEMHRELVCGEVVETMPPGFRHGLIATNIGFFLKYWARQQGGGYVGGESGFLLQRDPDILRGPDVFFISKEKVTTSDIVEGFSDIIPDLVVEVISPSESAEGILRKIGDYIAAGVAVFWAVYPVRRAVVVHTPDGVARILQASDTITAPDILPGFSCIVEEFFA